MFLLLRFYGEVGDVVVGRITEVRTSRPAEALPGVASMQLLNVLRVVLQVQQKRWKVETNSRLDSVLLLSSVNLPGGELVSTALTS